MCTRWFLCLLVAVGYSNPGDRSGVTAQEEEGDVAGGGHQVDHHGHADGAQSGQVQLLHQQPPEEDTQTGTGDGCHTWGRGCLRLSRGFCTAQMWPLYLYFPVNYICWIAKQNNDGFHAVKLTIRLPSSWLAEEVVRLNCCSRYFPRKAAKPATTAISMQAASVMQLNTGLERRCLVTWGMTASVQEEMERKNRQIIVSEMKQFQC